MGWWWLPIILMIGLVFWGGVVLVVGNWGEISSWARTTVYGWVAPTPTVTERVVAKTPVVVTAKEPADLKEQPTPSVVVPTTMPTVVSPTVTPTATPTTTPTMAPTGAMGEVAFTLKGKSFPKGSVVFHSNFWKKGEPDDSDQYVLVYDTQWYYQPLLPKATDRVAHEVALVLIPGVYEFIGPECQVWWNWDGKSPADQGKQLVNRQNILYLVVPETVGKDEAWVFVKCRASQAGGFSFRRIGPLPTPTATSTPKPKN